MAEKSRKPRLRFRGFTETWEQRKAKELCSIGTGKSNTQDQADDGKYPFYIRSDVPVRSNKYLYDCEAVITIGDGNIGKVFHYVNGKFDLHQRCYKMTDFQDIWGKYFFYYFSTKFYDRAMKMTAKATVDSVRLEMISEMDILKPPHFSEQKQIADYFSQLDNLITLHQRKYDKFVAIKKALLEKMFPRDGKSVPEIRFKGFTETWEQRKLKDCSSEIVAGGDIDKNNIKISGKYPVIANALTDEGIVGYYDDCFRVPAPAITVTGRGDVGHAKARKTNFTPVVRLLSIKTSHNEDFVENAINNLNVIVESTGVPQLTVPQLQNYVISFPLKADEEIKIGLCLVKLDNLITLHQQQLERLKNIKSALLEKMFV